MLTDDLDFVDNQKNHYIFTRFSFSIFLTKFNYIGVIVNSLFHRYIDFIDSGCIFLSDGNSILLAHFVIIIVSFKLISFALNFKNKKEVGLM
jgi:hypothetical protein